MKLLAERRRAYHDFEILETYEAGISLKGWEVKSIKAGNFSIEEAWVDNINGELYIIDMHVSPYQGVISGVEKVDPKRPKKLLLHKHEISKIIGKMTLKRLTVIPLKVYIKNRWIKVLIAVVRGKKKYEKREKIKKKMQEKEIKKYIWK